jgi:hypothetical protein
VQFELEPRHLGGLAGEFGFLRCDVGKSSPTLTGSAGMPRRPRRSPRVESRARASDAVDLDEAAALERTASAAAASVRCWRHVG